MLENMTTEEKVIAGLTAVGIAALIFHKPTRNAVGLSDGKRKKLTLSESNIQFVLWGVPPVELLKPNDEYKHMERFLCEKDGSGKIITDRKFAEYIKKDFEERGFTKVRIGTVDMGTPPNFIKAMNKK